MKCKKCGHDSSRTNPMCIDGGYINLCPICALKVRNEFFGLPPDTPFRGEMAQEMYEAEVEERQVVEDK